MRPLENGDIPAVAKLFLRTFRRTGERPSTTLQDYLRHLYLESELYDPEICSLVHVDHNGTVCGFLGVLRFDLLFHDEPIRAAVLGTFMTNGQAGATRVAGELLTACAKGPQELTFSDTANMASLLVAELAGGEAIPQASLEWVRVFKPACFGLHVWRHRIAAPMVRVLRPVTQIADTVLGRFTRAAAPDALVAGFSPQPADVSEFAKLANRMNSHLTIRPSWDGGRMAEVIELARQRRSNGPLHLRIVKSPAGRTAGGYACYARPGGVAYAVHVFAGEKTCHGVLAALIAEMAELGCVAVRGPVLPGVQRGLMRHEHILFHHNARFVAAARDERILSAIRNGEALVGGLTGDGWAALVSDDFSDVRLS